MHDTLVSLVRKALTGNQKLLEFYLREHSRLPGPRANLELANDVAQLLAASTIRYPDGVRSLLNYFANGDRRMIASNTPAEFVMLCGIIGYGACVAAEPEWCDETFKLLDHYASSPYWRVREGVALAYQEIVMAPVPKALPHLMNLASDGNFLQQRAAIAAVAEPALLAAPEARAIALQMQRVVLERLRRVPALERKCEEFRVLRRTLGYTISVVTAVIPEQGFALMRECASWNDPDVIWILRENLKKKRLAKFAQDTEDLARLLA
jgi:hypothetical protein